MTQIAKQTYTPEEYLVLEAKRRDKHEYYNGQIYLMAGTTLTHNRITQNIQGGLYAALRGSGCEAFGSDLRVYVPESGFYTYPDVSVACDPQTITVQGLDLTLALTDIYERVTVPEQPNDHRP